MPNKVGRPKKPIMLNGQEYESAGDAARVLGVSRSTVRNLVYGRADYYKNNATKIDEHIARLEDKLSALRERKRTIELSKLC